MEIYYRNYKKVEDVTKTYQISRVPVCVVVQLFESSNATEQSREFLYQQNKKLTSNVIRLTLNIVPNIGCTVKSPFMYGLSPFDASLGNSSMMLVNFRQGIHVDILIARLTVFHLEVRLPNT